MENLMALIHGKASIAATARSAHKGATQSDVLGNLTISDIGWGTQTGEVKNIVDLKYETAVSQILKQGINFIDMAPAYRCRRSMLALGKELARLIKRGKVSREDIVLCAQAGYVPFNRVEVEDPSEFLKDVILPKSNLSESDFVGSAWSMHPDWIREQFDLSVELTGIEHFDIFLLNSPDVALSVIHKDEWRDHIRIAFSTLESLRQEGKISYWGISTLEGFKANEAGKAKLSLQELQDLAQQAVGKDNGFKVIQFPYSLGMLDFLNAKVDDDMTLQQQLLAKGLFSISSLSLGQGQLISGLPKTLAEIMPETSSDAQRALQFARSTQGINCALVGMKTKAHIQENLSLLNYDKTSQDAWQSLFG
jgi:aryl-alcohol dehydrogenase-like predicted oxidoreductase